MPKGIHDLPLDYDLTLGHEMQIRVHPADFAGDRHIPEGKGFMIDLVNECRPNKIPYLERRHQLSDGTIINCRLSHGVQIVDIYLVSDVSGLCQVPISGLRTNLYDKWFYHKYQDRWWKDSDSDPTTNIPAWAEYPPVSSNYSGEMRAVMQYLQGITSDEYQYYPNWSHTQGVYIQEVGAKRIPWIIDISDKGAFARLMPICKAIDVDLPSKEARDDYNYFKERYKYIPVVHGGGFHDIDLDKIDDPGYPWKQVMQKEVIAEFFSNEEYGYKLGIYDRCGWAFNSLGTACDNTCYQIEAPDSNTIGNHFYHYRITIIPDDDGKPNTTSFSLISDGYAKDENALLKSWIPDGSGDLFGLNLGQCVWPATCTQLGGEGERSTIFVCYKGDALDGVDFLNEKTLIDETRTDLVWVPYTSGGLVGTNGYLTGCGQHTGIDGSEVIKEPSMLVRYGEDVPATNQHRIGHWKQLDEVTHDEWAYQIGGGISGEKIMPRWHDILYHIKWNRDEAIINYSSAVIPPSDRESYFIYNYSTVADSWTSEQYSRGQWVDVASGGSADLGHKTVIWNPHCVGVPPVYVSPCTNWTGRWQESTTHYNNHGECIPSSASPFPSSTIFEWNDDGTPYTIALECPGWGYTAYGLGWCPETRGDNLSNPTSWTISTPQESKIHSHSLVLISSDIGAVTLFDETEPYDTNPGNEFGETFYIPAWGNNFIVSAYTQQRMDVWTDAITGLSFYSPDMNKNLGTDYLGVHGEYPINELPSSVMRAWIGLPGDTT